jgi:hypothetical protein
MPWRNFTTAAFETTETTDMSTAKLEAMLNEGWWEVRPHELQLATLCRGYGVENVKDALTNLIERAAQGGNR